MRPNIARKRCSYTPSRVKWRERTYFVLRTEPLINRRMIDAGIGVAVWHTIGTAAVAAAICLLPRERPLVLGVYLPVLGLIAARWIGDLCRIPLGMLLLGACAVCFYWAASVPNFNPLMQVLFGLSAVSFVLPFLARFLVSISVGTSRRSTLWLAALLSGVGLLWLTEHAPWLWRLLGAGQCGLTAVWCLWLVRASVIRLAAAPETPTAGSYALVELSRSLWDVPHGRRVPGLRWWGCVIATGCAAWGAWLVLAQWPRGATNLEEGIHSVGLVGLATIGALLAASWASGTSLTAHTCIVTPRFLVALLWWWSDPALQLAVDRRSRSRLWAMGGRRGLTFGLVVLLALGVIVHSTGGGLADWRQMWRDSSWGECVLRALWVAGEAVTWTALAAWLLCGPWLGYAERKLADASRGMDTNIPEAR